MLTSLCLISLLAAQDGSLFPLPGHPAEVPADRTRIRAVTSWDDARRFYDERFRDVPRVRIHREEEAWRFESTDTSHAWRQATVAPTPGGVLVRVRPFFRLQPADITGEAPPRIHLVIPRDGRAAREGTAQEHLLKPGR